MIEVELIVESNHVDNLEKIKQMYKMDIIWREHPKGLSCSDQLASIEFDSTNFNVMLVDSESDSKVYDSKNEFVFDQHNCYTNQDYFRFMKQQFLNCYDRTLDSAKNNLKNIFCTHSMCIGVNFFLYVNVNAHWDHFQKESSKYKIVSETIQNKYDFVSKETFELAYKSEKFIKDLFDSSVDADYNRPSTNIYMYPAIRKINTVNILTRNEVEELLEKSRYWEEAT